MQAQPSDSQTIRIWCPLSIFNRLVLQIMYYSNFFRHGSRAGLVALIFVLIISLVSAVPIPAAEFGLSTTLSPSSLNGQPEAYNAKILLNASSQISTLPTTRALIRRGISTDMDDQLVRRDNDHKEKLSFHKAGMIMKHVAHFKNNLKNATRATRERAG